MVPSFWILSELDHMGRKASRGRDNPCLASSVGKIHCQHQIHLAGIKADIFSIARLRQDVWSSSSAEMSHPRSPSGRDELCISIIYSSSSLSPDDILPLEPVYSSFKWDDSSLKATFVWSQGNICSLSQEYQDVQTAHCCFCLTLEPSILPSWISMSYSQQSLLLKMLGKHNHVLNGCLKSLRFT